MYLDMVESNLGADTHLTNMQKNTLSLHTLERMDFGSFAPIPSWIREP